MRPVRVLIVDDSMTMRRLIRLALSADPRIEVVGEARDTRHARERLQELRPDVLTLDIEMPGESGLEFLGQLMALRPMPVVMISTETHAGSAAALEALALGAVECVGKPVNARTSQDFDMLPEIVVAAATAKVGPRRETPPPPPRLEAASHRFIWNGRYVLIGSSTGGVEALEHLLSGYPRNCPPTVITQHMPPAFLAGFAQRLDELIAPRVQLAATGVPLEPGNVYIAPGGETHLTLAMPRSPVCQLITAEKRNGHRPSVDYLFESAVPLASGLVAVMLTGMGCDGARGMLELRRNGAICLAQDEASCVVFGMPRVAWEMGAVDRLVPLSDMGAEILRAAGRGVGFRRAATAG